MLSLEALLMDVGVQHFAHEECLSMRALMRDFGTLVWPQHVWGRCQRNAACLGRGDAAGVILFCFSEDKFNINHPLCGGGTQVLDKFLCGAYLGHIGIRIRGITLKKCVKVAKQRLRAYEKPFWRLRKHNACSSFNLGWLKICPHLKSCYAGGTGKKSSNSEQIVAPQEGLNAAEVHQSIILDAIILTI